jgi:uncharacterized protein YdhG (YjbR/CyaY superfamily)
MILVQLQKDIHIAMKKEVKDYYNKAPKESLARLKKLEDIIDSLLKDYELVLSYGVPTFVYQDKKIVGIGGYKEFVSLYPLGHALIDKYKAELKDFNTSRGAIQFPHSKPLPAVLINKIVQDRINS